MTIDLGQFISTFIEEGMEMLSDMEQALLGLQQDSADSEKINRVFRAAHSIKSASAVFDLTDMSQLAHTLEDYLEKVRSGERCLTAEDINSLLEAVDCMRGMLCQVQQGQPIQNEQASKLQKKFYEALQAEALSTKPPASQQQTSTEEWEPASEQVLQSETVSQKGNSKKAGKPLKVAAHTTSIRVGTEKIDELMNVVGELVIAQSMLGQMIENFEPGNLKRLQEGLSYLQNNSLKLQEGIMRIRMVPIETVFNRLPRTVYDISLKTGKQVDLEFAGEQTELDKTVIEKITDPLLRIVRNAIDHGIEEPDVCSALGKNRVGSITLNAYQENGSIFIEVTDDGRGIDIEKIKQKAVKEGLLKTSDELTQNHLFEILSHPGFSTADIITDISGRGVGLDVVYRNIMELGGHIDVQTELNKGTTFKIRLPLTLAIIDGQMIKVNQEYYILPLVVITEMAILQNDLIKIVEGRELYELREYLIPIIYLDGILTIEKNDFIQEKEKGKFLIIVEKNNEYYGLVCDEALAQSQIVIKNLDENYKKIPGVSGATILGDGSPALILDVSAIIDMAFQKKRQYSLIKKNKQEEDICIQPKERFQMLSFLINEKEYGIDIGDVMEICFFDKITPLPNVESSLKGIINLRGTLIPIIDIMEKFGLGKQTFKFKNPIITAYVMSEKRKKTIGFLVDALSDTYFVNQSEIKFIPESLKEISPNIMGVINLNEKTVTLISINGLL